MRKKINALANGQFSYEQPRLLPSEERLEVSVQMGHKIYGRLTLTNHLEQPMKGMITSSHPVVELINTGFVAATVTVEYVIHGDYMRAGDQLDGELTCILDCGETTIPFSIEAVPPYLTGQSGQVANLTQFSALAATGWTEAVRLFSEDVMGPFLRHHKPEALAVWEHLRRSSSAEQALEEFLVYYGFKSRCLIQTDTTPIRLTSSGQAVTGQLLVTLQSWGHIRLLVSGSCPQLVPAQSELQQEDFRNGGRLLEFTVRADLLPEGTHQMELVLSTAFQQVRIPVICRRTVENQAEIDAAKKIERLTDACWEMHCSCALGLMSTGRYIAEAEAYLEELVAGYAKGYLEQRLYRAYLERLAGREGQSNWLLRTITAEEYDKGSALAKGIYLYLKATRAQSSREELQQQIEELYQNAPEEGVLGLLLLQLGSGKLRSGRQKFSWLAKVYEQAKQGRELLLCHAAKLIVEEPATFHELTPFSREVIAYCLKKGVLSKELAAQMAFLSERSREDSESLLPLLIRMYDRFPGRELTAAICTILLKNRIRGEEYAIWYERGVYWQLRIPDLYEAFLETTPQDLEKPLDGAILSYFIYDTHLLPEHQAYLYANIITNREAEPKIYEQYRERIRSFALEQAKKGACSRCLAVIYRSCLEQPQTAEKLLPYLERIAFWYEVTTDNENFTAVCVKEEFWEEEVIYPLHQGRAQLSLVNGSCILSFLDCNQVRYLAEERRVLHRYLQAEDCYREALAVSVQPRNLLVYFAEKARAEVGGMRDQHEIAAQTLSMTELSGRFRSSIAMRVLLQLEKALTVQELAVYCGMLDASEIPRKYWERMVSAYSSAGLGEQALLMLLHYGGKKLGVELVEKVCSTLPPTLFGTYSEEITELLYRAFEQGGRGKWMMNHLVRAYHGPTMKLYRLFGEAEARGHATVELAERLLMQMLFTESYLQYSDDVFERYTHGGKSRQLIRAYLTYAAYKYLQSDVPIGAYTLTFLQRDIYMDENRLCVLALLEHLSQLDELDESEQEFAKYWLYRMKARGLVLPEFCRLSKYFPLPEGLADQVLVSYRANPRSRVTLHMKLEQNGHTSKRELPMRNICCGIFVREMVLFEGEEVQYYISEDDGKEVRTGEPVSLIAHVAERNSGSRFGKLNQIIAARSERRQEQALRLLESYVKDNFAIEQLFKTLGEEPK